MQPPLATSQALLEQVVASSTQPPEDNCRRLLESLPPGASVGISVGGDVGISVGGDVGISVGGDVG
jgi:hypothetical protein